MPSLRGEFAPVHPKYAADSPARCQDWKAIDPKDIVDLVYSAEDNAAIEQWIRENVGTTLVPLALDDSRPVVPSISRRRD